MFASFGKGRTSASSAFCGNVIGNLIGHGSLGSLLLIYAIVQNNASNEIYGLASIL